jgi:pimeloyl-ACP methyl ester carboxylesterase
LASIRSAGVAGSSIAYRRVGSGPTVVLLHGFASDSRLWQPQLDGLSSSFDVVAWDAPGAGQTPDPPRPFEFDDWAARLTGFMDALDIGRAHLIGISWGGTLAQVFAIEHDDRVRSLVLADTYAGWSGSFGADVAARRLEGALADAELAPAAFAERYIPGMFGPTPPTMAVAAMSEVLADRHPAAFRQMATVLAEADTRELLPRIRIPTLLVWGDQDARSPIAVGRAFEAAIPGARLVVLEGAGHVSNLDRPAEFNAAVLEFLQGL